MDVESETPSLESVRVENKFANVFPDNFRVICPDGEIDFGIDLLLDTQPISISHCGMALTELKEFEGSTKELSRQMFCSCEHISLE